MTRSALPVLALLAAACSPTLGSSNPPTGHPSGGGRFGTNVSGTPTGVAISDSGVVFVTQQTAGTVARFKLPSLALINPVIAVGAKPVDITFLPNGNTAYVANKMDQTVGVIDVATHTQTSTISVPGDPLRVAASPDGSTVYAGLSDGLLAIINTSTNTMVALTMPGTLNGLGFSPTLPILYVSSTEGTIYEVNTTTGSIARFFTTDAKAQEVVVSLDGSTLFIANETGELQVRGTAALDSITTVPTVTNGYGMALTRDGTQLYITSPANGNVTVMNVASRTVVNSFPGGSPQRIAFDPPGTTAAIANASGYVTWVQ